MKTSLQPQKVSSSILFLLLVAVEWTNADEKLPICSRRREGNQTLYQKSSGDDGVLICMKTSGQYGWKTLDGSSALGEHFNPAKDCSDIVDNLPEAKDGFYWIRHIHGNISKAWCDTHTDGGGFVLIGMKENPVTWNVPSNENPVHPFGPPHWSSKFGDDIIQDFAIQVSTTRNFNDTKAHWSYRLKENRALNELFGVERNGCTDIHSGIGNVSHVKDILTDTVVTTTFKCSKFGPHTDPKLGWGRMNYCLGNKCPTGFAYLEGFPFRLDSHGSFSYSTSAELSGITHDSTAFVGCVAGKCCACFGPKGGRGHYCSQKCKALNGGTVETGNIYIWFWIRTRMPQRLWSRCMEFEKKTEAGKYETFHVNRMSGTTQKGTCSKQLQTSFYEGTLLVKDQESFDKLPAVPGVLSFREDNDKLYVNKRYGWEAVVNKNEFDSYKSWFRSRESSLWSRLRSAESRLTSVEYKARDIGKWPSGSYCILEGDTTYCPSGFSSIDIVAWVDKLTGFTEGTFGESSLKCHDKYGECRLGLKFCCK